MIKKPLTTEVLQSVAWRLAVAQVFCFDDENFEFQPVLDQLESAIENPDLLTYKVCEQYETLSPESLLSIIEDYRDGIVHSFYPYTTD